MEDLDQGKALTDSELAADRVLTRATPHWELPMQAASPIDYRSQPTVGMLDYPKAEIRMLAETAVEQKWRLHACAKEPWTVQWIESMQPGEAFYDVGANVGPYTLIAAKRGLEVVAIEPGYANYAHLAENLRINALDALALPIALGRATTVEPLAYSDTSAGAASHRFGGVGGTADHPYAQQVLTFRLDNLVRTFGLPAPNHIKLDVDGAEMEVLEGAVETLADAAFRSMLMEMQTDREAALTAKARALGLRLVERFDTSTSDWVRDNVAYGLFRRMP